MKWFFSRVFKDIRQGNNIDLIAIVAVGNLISAINLIGGVSQQIVMSVILATLGLVAIGLLVTRYKIEEINTAVQRPSFFLDRDQIRERDSFREVIDRSNDLFVGGVALGRTVRGHRQQLLNQLKKGARLRFLVLNPHSPDVYSIAQIFGVPHENIRNDIGSTLHNLAILQNQAKSTDGMVEIRLLSHKPGFSFLISNPKSPNRYFNAGLRLFGESSIDRPYFLLESSDKWGDKFLEGCENLWRSSVQWAGNKEVFKPVKQIAGTVAYRPMKRGGVEILLITARTNPESWIFPMGHVDIRESLQQTAARECVEESGYIVDIDVKLGAIEFDEGESISQMTFFLGRVTGETSTYEKDRRREWVPLSELNDNINKDFLIIAQSAIVKLSKISV